MRKLSQLILILTLVLGFLIGFHLVDSVQPVYALADCVCTEWDCTWYDPPEIPLPGDPYPEGFWQCECHQVHEYVDIDWCRSEKCPPGTYVCNTDDQCCDEGVVGPGVGDGGDDGDPETNTCGDGSCDSNEDCVNCPNDCGVCCGDGSCNYGESCLNCETDCGVCPPGTFCGDGNCDYDEFCNGCVLDCGFCPSCGDSECSGFETCLTCEEDCGACTDNFAWWQVWGGSFAAESDFGYVIRSAIPDMGVCIEPNCYPYLSTTDRADTANSDGFPLIAGGEVLANGQISDREEQVFVAGTSRTRFRETYSYFYSKYSLGFSPIDDYSGSDGDALEPVASKEAYFHSGDMTIQSPWDVTDGESHVIFIDGDLNIEDPLAVGELITIAEGGFLAFIVSGDINIADSVGNYNLANTTSNIEGVFISDGTLTIESNGAMDKRFICEGTFVGWTDVELLRDYEDEALNESYPTETFVYRPDFVKNTPEKMKRAQILWQETN